MLIFAQLNQDDGETDEKKMIAVKMFMEMEFVIEMETLIFILIYTLMCARR